jgi:6-phosphogluconolactonase (cycloisomerase 2 family)
MNNVFSYFVRNFTGSSLALVAGMLVAGCATSDESSSDLADTSQELGVAHRGGVYLIDNAIDANSVLSFRRSDDGRLTPAGRFHTGGRGTGAGLGSQGSVVLANDALFVVNAGSDQISSFERRGDGLLLRDVVSSGGANPISLTVHEDRLYVLNAGRGDTAANVTGFRIRHGHLVPLAGSTRPLSAAAPDPAQIEVDPSGEFVVVTEKATNQLVTYPLDETGRPGQPIVSPSSGQTPFGFAFTDDGTLVVSEAFGGAAGASAVSSYRLDQDGRAAVISGSVPTEQSSACWIAIGRGDRDAYAANTGSNTVSGFRIHDDGSLERFGDGGATASVGVAPADMAFTADRRILYVRNGGNDTIDVLREAADGTLTRVQQVSGLPVESVGLAAF